MTLYQMADGSTCHVSWAGPFYKIEVGARVYTFEDHPYHGIMPVNSKTLVAYDPAPRKLWEAIDQWEKGGKLVEDGWALWEPAPACQDNVFRADGTIGHCLLAEGHSGPCDDRVRTGRLR